MHLKGHKVITAPRSVCYQLLTDPEVLVKTMPGLKSMQEQDDGTFQATLEMGVASIKGRYTGTMAIVDPVSSESYRLKMDGQGPGGFVNVDMVVSFVDTDEGCDVTYEGEAKVGGTVAGVGQRMVSGVASYILNQFFGNVAKEAQKLGG